MNYAIAIIVIIISAYLFKKASGTLKINLINVTGYVFYSLMIFEFIGITLVFLGFRDHYLIDKITNDNVINIAYWCMAYTMIILPLTILLFNKYVFKIKNVKETYIENINKEVELEDKKYCNRVFILVTIGLSVCLIATIYVFYCIGYIPLFKFLDSTFDFATERIKSARSFGGNQYIKNIVMLMITPLLSYIAYIYMRTTKENKWKVLFGASFILNFFVKTYNFEKAPIIYYICFFFIIEVMLGKTSKFKKVLPYIITACLLVVIMYSTVAGYKGKMLSLSNGPLSRLMISQAGTLMLHFEAFSDKTPYLHGHSFPPFTKIFFGEGEYDIRSGREVMEVYNPVAVKNGTAGVMSTMFMGEAYANFGFVGVAIAPIIVGIIFSAILCVYLKSKKTLLNIILYLECFIIFTNVLQAGFIDFFYNINFFVALICIFGIKCFASEKTIGMLKRCFKIKE